MTLSQRGVRRSVKKQKNSDGEEKDESDGGRIRPKKMNTESFAKAKKFHDIEKE